MQQWLIKELVKPMVRRLGTGITGYLVGLGIATDVINTIVLGASAAAMVAVELVFSNKERKK